MSSTRAIRIPGPTDRRRFGEARAGAATAARVLLALAVCSSFVACGDDDPTGPPATSGFDVLALNSTGQTLAPYEVRGDEILPAGQAMDLGAGFDGDGLVISGDRAASAVSSFGGSSLVLVNLASGAVRRALFPGPEAALVNPSRPSFDAGDSVWVGGRGSDAVYRLDPGAAEATLVASDVGTFVERVIPDGARLYAIDANLDDDGLTYAPRGPGRVVELDRRGAVQGVIVLPADAPNPSDGLLAGGRLIVLAGGSFNPADFTPNSDGALILVDPASRRVIATRPLGANGVRLSLGEDGRAYVTTTSDFETLNLLRFDPASGEFERGPADPVATVDANGTVVHCWTATALEDGRVLCATFRTDAPGRLLLLRSSGRALSETPAGFGTTDLGIRR